MRLSGFALAAAILLSPAAEAHPEHPEFAGQPDAALPLLHLIDHSLPVAAGIAIGWVLYRIAQPVLAKRRQDRD